MRANRATLTATQETFNVQFGAWLSKREIGGAQACAHCRPKHTLGKIVKSALQVAKSNTFPHRQQLHLGELQLVSCVKLFVPVAHTWQDGPDWVGSAFPHHVNLPGGSLRA